MNWITNDNKTLCGPYSIRLDIRGYSVFVYSGNSSTRLGQDVPTLTKAKQLCHDHAERESIFVSGAI